MRGLAHMSDSYAAYVMPSDDPYIAFCEEVASANGQFRTKEEALDSLFSAIELLLERHRDEVCSGLLPGAENPTVEVGCNGVCFYADCGLPRHGCELHHEGANHSGWRNPRTGGQELVPGTARLTTTWQRGFADASQYRRSAADILSPTAEQIYETTT